MKHDPPADPRLDPEAVELACIAYQQARVQRAGTLPFHLLKESEQNHIRLKVARTMAATSMRG